MISSHDLTPILISTEIIINKFPMSKLLPLWIWFDPSIKKFILKKKKKKVILGTSLVQWLRLCASSAGRMHLIPGDGTKIPHAVQCGQ